MEPYCPADALYPPMGVELNASLVSSCATELPIRCNSTSILHPLNAHVPMVVQAGKLIVVKALHPAKAFPLTIEQTGKLVVVRDLHPEKA